MFKKSLFLFILVFVSCSSDSESEEMATVLSEEEEAFLEQYEYITFKLDPSSNGAPLSEKWTGELNLFLGGGITSEYRALVENELVFLNDLITDGTILKTVDSVEESNVQLYLGPSSEIEPFWPDMFELLRNANFSGYALYSYNGSFNIFNGRIWVKNDGMPIFRHELGHILGLGHSSVTYCSAESLDDRSYMCSSLAKEYSDFDKGIIKVLYHPDIQTGQNFMQLSPIIEELLLTDKVIF